VKVLPFGDAALLVEVDGLPEVLALAAAVRDARPAGMLDVVPAARTVLVTVAPGTDLAEVARLTGLSEDDVVAAHTGTPWRIAFGGFAPGFAYLTGGDERLRVSRRDEPRTTVPAGAVGLAGEFSGVYPRPSPGGWQLIGSTDVQLWEPDRDPPALLEPGGWVRFVVAGGTT
jgi:KipI family sensor histidine kinase inhibitor